MIRLRLIEEGEASFHTFRHSPVVIGRSATCDLSLPEARGLSRYHCRIAFASDGASVQDLGSRNLTLVNGEPVTSAALKEGDRLSLGSCDLVVDALRWEEEHTEQMVQPCLHCGHLFAQRLPVCPRCDTSVERRGRSRTIGAHRFRGYRLLRRLGSGGMGIVFLAEDLAGEHEHVALKVLRPHLARDAGYLVRFLEEIRSLTRLRHEAIVEVYGHGREEDLHYLTMEYVPGASAREAMVRAGGRLPWRRAVEIVYEAARGLLAAHEQAAIVHGDLKPGNFLLPPGGVKICDFGLARSVLEAGPRSFDEAGEAERRGTAGYAAPERFRTPPTLSADIYALGVALYQLVAGQLPFRARSVQELRAMHESAAVPDPRRIVPDALPALHPLLERMMAKEPRRRHQGHEALLSDLAMILG